MVVALSYEESEVARARIWQHIVVAFIQVFV
jgi:hypothetical protein